MSLPYLLDFLLEVGPAGAGAMGQVPLDFHELAAWADRTGLSETLQPWEYLAIRRLSSEWCGQADASSEMDCPAPYKSSESAPEEGVIVAKGLRALIGGMAS